MIRDWLESFRYTNHLWPILVLRLYVGWSFLSQAMMRQSSDYTKNPQLSALIDEHLFANAPPEWLGNLFINYVQPNWKFFSLLQLDFEWTVGLLFLIGFLNRPLGLLTMIYLVITSYIVSPVAHEASLHLSWMLLCLVVFGSGRVAGIDYYFYKRQRGLLW